MERLKQKFQKSSKIVSRATISIFVVFVLVVCFLYANYERQALYSEYKIELKNTAQRDSAGLRLLFETPIALMESFATSPLFSKDLLDHEAVSLRMEGLISSASFDFMVFLTVDQQLIHTSDFNRVALDDAKEVIASSNDKRIFYLPSDCTSYVVVVVPCFKQGEYLGSLLGFCNGEVFSNLLTKSYVYNNDDRNFLLVNKKGYIIASNHTNQEIVIGCNLLDVEQGFRAHGDGPAKDIEQALVDRHALYFDFSDQSGMNTFLYLMPFSVLDYETYGWSVIASVDRSVIYEKLKHAYAFTGVMFVLLCALVSAIVSYRNKMLCEHKKLELLIRNVPGGVHRCQLFDRIHVDYLSEGLCRLTGYTAEEIQNDLNGKYVELIAKEDQAIFEKAIADLCKNEEHRVLEYRMRRKDGHEFWVMDSITSIRDAHGKMRAYAVVVDFDDTKERYEQLSLSQPRVIESVETTVATEKDIPSVFIRTFGYFDVFVNGEAISFKSAKSKELLAVLVERKGGYVTSSELATYLYDDDALPKVLLTRCRKAAMNLKNTLEEYGVGELIETENNTRKINLELCVCDYYQYLAGDKNYIDSFHGEYMVNYSWSEATVAQLSRNSHIE